MAWLSRRILFTFWKILLSLILTSLGCLRPLLPFKSTRFIGPVWAPAHSFLHNLVTLPLPLVHVVHSRLCCFLLIFVVTPAFLFSFFSLSLSVIHLCCICIVLTQTNVCIASVGTYSNIGREDSRNYFESKIFHLPVWHCLQAACARNKYIIDGNSSLHKLIHFQCIFL